MIVQGLERHIERIVSSILAQACLLMAIILLWAALVVWETIGEDMHTHIHAQTRTFICVCKVCARSNYLMLWGEPNAGSRGLEHAQKN